MATPIPDSTTLVNIEETDFQSAVSEAVMQKLGGGINYAINTTSGFDSRLDTLEALTATMNDSWFYTTTPDVYSPSNVLQNVLCSLRRLSYLELSNIIIVAVECVATGLGTMDFQCPSWNIDTSKLPLVSGSTYQVPFSVTSPNPVGSEFTPSVSWNNSNKRFRLVATNYSGTDKGYAIGILPKIY